MQEDKGHRFLKKQVNWYRLPFYQKADTLYQMTYTFCSRFLKNNKDRTVDQMVQAARSGKQNIVEGSADGSTSTEMEIKLLNVSRASIQELREDYKDYLISRKLTMWTHGHSRYQPMIEFCRKRNIMSEYEPYFEKWNDEEMANVALTLCHMIDSMMNTYIREREEEFVKEGGIKERMHAARTGYRQDIDKRVSFLEKENKELKEENARLKAIIEGRDK